MEATQIEALPHQPEGARGNTGSPLLVGSNPWASNKRGEGEADRRDRNSPRSMKDAGQAAEAWEEQQQQRPQQQQQQQPPGRDAAAIAAMAAPLETSQLDPRAPVRKGKWTPEEEVYTTRIINDFNKGLLPLAPGTTLRSYLSEKLNW